MTENVLPLDASRSFSIETNENGLWLAIKSPQLREALCEIARDEHFIRRSIGGIPLIELFPIFEDLKDAAISRGREDHYELNLQPLVNAIREHVEKYVQELRVFDHQGVISFGTLWVALRKKDPVVYSKPEGIQAAVIESCGYSKNPFSGRSFDVITRNIWCDGEKYLFCHSNFFIPEFEGVISWSDLPFRPVMGDDIEALTERGKRYSKLAMGSHYLDYQGLIRRDAKYTNFFTRADGRVMIDPRMMGQFDPNYSGFSRRQGVISRTYEFSKNDEDNTPPENDLYLCPPSIHGFSFRAKKWGEFSMDNLKPITFDETAITHLVIEPERKSVIRSLVEHSEDSFSDIISGKGGGCIFLLHGEPGTGKTLTAEAVAEVLERPLYSITVGELGTDPKELEKTLQEILELATVWNAVILIDEADIFLEARNQHDIHRNAMVGIFLRLLEYHQGVLFLTTNRVENFDKAFRSRITLSLKYDVFTDETRALVWKNLLAAAGLDTIKVNPLAKHDLNGRQIKNAIRLGETLAKAENTNLAFEHLTRAIGFVNGTDIIKSQASQ
jgi:hypothetical protein